MILCVAKMPCHWNICHQVKWQLPGNQSFLPKTSWGKAFNHDCLLYSTEGMGSIWKASSDYWGREGPGRECWICNYIGRRIQHYKRISTVLLHFNLHAFVIANIHKTVRNVRIPSPDITSDTVFEKSEVISHRLIASEEAVRNWSV